MTKRKGDFRSKIDSILADDDEPAAGGGSTSGLDRMFGAQGNGRPGDQALARHVAPTTETKLDEIDLQKIKLPRGRRTDADRELNDSIGKSGILQPLLLRPMGAGFEVLDGGRRLAVARELGLKTVPAVVRSIADSEARAMSAERKAVAVPVARAGRRPAASAPAARPVGRPRKAAAGATASGAATGAARTVRPRAATPVVAPVSRAVAKAARAPRAAAKTAPSAAKATPSRAAAGKTRASSATRTAGKAAAQGADRSARLARDVKSVSAVKVAGVAATAAAASAAAAEKRKATAPAAARPASRAAAKPAPRTGTSKAKVAPAPVARAPLAKPASFEQARAARKAAALRDVPAPEVATSIAAASAAPEVVARPEPKIVFGQADETVEMRRPSIAGAAAAAEATAEETMIWQRPAEPTAAPAAAAADETLVVSRPAPESAPSFPRTEPAPRTASAAESRPSGGRTFASTAFLVAALFSAAFAATTLVRFGDVELGVQAGVVCVVALVLFGVVTMTGRRTGP